MRVFFILLIFALLAVVCKAQDVIVTKDSKSIKVLVIQVTKDRVRYKHYDNAESPTYYIPIGKVSYIHYENGAIDRFDDEEEEVEDVYYDTRTPSNRTSATRAPSQRYYDDGHSRQHRSQATKTYSYNAPVRNISQWSLRAGLNFNMLNISYEDDLGACLGFNVGVLGEFPINDFLCIQTGLLLNTRGAKETEKEDDYKYTSSINIYELQLPAYLTLGFWLSDESNVRFKLHAGPTLGLGISAKSKYKGAWNGSTVKDSRDLYERNNHAPAPLKRFNLCLTIGGGFQFNRFYIGVANDFGLIDLYGDDNGNFTVKTNSLMVNIGYSL
jgi:hypothetical protein